MEIWEFTLHIFTCITSLYVGKQHRTNNKPQNHVKWPWIEPRSHRKKQQYAQVYVSTIYCYIYAHISVEYLCKISHTSLRIVRNMQNSLETCGDFLYAPSLGCLCSNPYLHEANKIVLQHSGACRVEPWHTATSVIRSPCYYSHFFWPPNKNNHIFSCTETLTNTVTLLLQHIDTGSFHMRCYSYKELRWMGKGEKGRGA